MAYLLNLARHRSLPAAALLFLLLVDEIEGLVFVAVGLVLHRVDLFLAAQDALFPAAVMVAAVASAARNWRRTRPTPPPPIETLELSLLAQRIGAAR